jgi:heme/copper-type cytochrome/quinol oxidase subunit 2
MGQNESRRPSVPAIFGTPVFAALLLWLLPRAAKPQQAPRVIEVLANHYSRYQMQGLSTPSITVTAGERVHLRITAIRAKNRNRDGSIHGFSLLRPKDHKPVPGWELLLKPGLQEFDLTAPEEPGEYLVVCTVICSENHDGMNMKFVVEPAPKTLPDSEVRK